RRSRPKRPAFACRHGRALIAHRHRACQVESLRAAPSRPGEALRTLSSARVGSPRASSRSCAATGRLDRSNHNGPTAAAEEARVRRADLAQAPRGPCGPPSRPLEARRPERRPRRPRRPPSHGALGAIGGYVLAVGAQPSVVRAGVAGGLGSLAWLASRQADRWYFLCLGALVLLAWNPYDVLDAGFQLSFVAVASIFVLVPRFAHVLDRYPLP